MFTIEGGGDAATASGSGRRTGGGLSGPGGRPQSGDSAKWEYARSPVGRTCQEVGVHAKVEGTAEGDKYAGRFTALADGRGTGPTRCNRRAPLRGFRAS